MESNLPTESTWRTAGSSDKHVKDRVHEQAGFGRTSKTTKQSARKRSPLRSPAKGSTAKGAVKTDETKLSSVDQGDGKVIFKQLENYLFNDAPADYVWDTVVKLDGKAKERRFQAYWLQAMKKAEKQIPEQQAREGWDDDIPEVLKSAYKDLTSYWDRSISEHADRMKTLLSTWIKNEKCKQGELEKRLRFFTFLSPASGPIDLNSHNTEADLMDQAGQRSYLHAVETGKATLDDSKAIDMKRLHALCVKPMETLTTPRPYTQDEERALLLILQHELEVPYPPRFLVQTMTGEEMARFSDIFKAIDYPLYAHLLPGQRFSENMPKQAILNQIHMGAEAAASQKQAIRDFKQDVSRISLDVNSRVLTVYFKGKKTALKWNGWQVPLAMKMLPLIDYESQREAAKTTNAIVALDYYTLTAVLRKGVMSSEDIFWLFKDKLGYAVHTVAHPNLRGDGINDKQWVISIKAPACPRKLRSTGYVIVSGVELLIHHQSVFNHWPCTKCGNPEHPEKYCRVSDDERQTTKAQFAWKVAGRTPSEMREECRSVLRTKHCAAHEVQL